MYASVIVPSIRAGFKIIHKSLSSQVARTSCERNTSPIPGESSPIY